MIKYLNNFSNVNTRSDNNSICAQNIENVISCTRPKGNIARCPLSVRLLAAVSYHLETVFWVLRPQATRVQCSGHSPATNTNASAPLTAVGILMRWLFSLPSPDRSQIKKDGLEKWFIIFQLEVDPRVSCGGDIKFVRHKGQKVHQHKPKEALTLCLLLTLTHLQERSELASTDGNGEGHGDRRHLKGTGKYKV